MSKFILLSLLALCSTVLAQNCQGGSYLSGGNCLPCPAGTTSYEFVSYPANTQVVASAYWQQPSCWYTAPGTYSPGTTYTGYGGWTVAYPPVLCSPGTYSSSYGATSCTLCPAGTYSSANGATSCTSCPWHSPNSLPGSASASQCTLCNSTTQTMCWKQYGNPNGNICYNGVDLSCCSTYGHCESPYPNCTPQGCR